jgi:benzoate-CoA ligase
MELSTVDFSQSPPKIDIPASYNAAHDLIERNLRAGRHAKLAYIDDHGAYTYADLSERIDRFAHALVGLGLHMEQRILLCLTDSIDFPTAFLGAIKAGVIPVAVNTLLKSADYAYMLHDSRAITLVVSESLLAEFSALIGQSPFLKHVVVSGSNTPPPRCLGFDALLAAARVPFEVAPTLRDEPCFWLYSSGSTGVPKGTVHVHSSLIETAYLYGGGVLGLQATDLVFSAAKLFFAYGLGNSLSFPLVAGATTVLMAERSSPATVIARLKQHAPTVFCGVPTLYAGLLANPDLPGADHLKLRRCTSAGEALPEDIARRWRQHTGVEILDGIGTTEMLHIFISNRPDDLRYGTVGRPVPGYEARIVDECDANVGGGAVGDLLVRGPTSAKFYWNQHQRSRSTFQGHWTRTGDKFLLDSDGYYVYAGRADDMLKVGGIYVSPIEVESALVTHPAVHEAAVVGREDAEHLVKPCAFVVLAAGYAASPDLVRELQQFVKQKLAPYKYPRWIEFVPELPKTATGKIQRFKLRALAGAATANAKAR